MAKSNRKLGMGIVASAAVIAGAAGLAQAGLSIVSSSRVLQVTGNVNEDGNQVAGDSKVIDGPFSGPWSEFATASASYGGGSGNASASQISDISTNGIQFSAITDTSGSGYENQIIDDQGFPITITGTGSATAYSALQMKFEISTASTWRLEATVSGSNGGSAQVVLTDKDGKVVSAIGDGTQDHQFDLAAGTYDIWMFANASVSASGMNFSESHGEFTGSLTQVPSPIALPVLGLCALASRRRR